MKNLKTNLKVISLNFLILFIFILFPPLLYSIASPLLYSLRIKESNKNKVIDFQNKNLSYKNPDLEAIKGIKKKYSKRFVNKLKKNNDLSFKSFLGWRHAKISVGGTNVEGPFQTRISNNQRLQKSIWFFGGSTMWGVGVEDDGTIPSQFAAKSGEYVYNFGESGWNTRQSLNQLLNLLAEKHKPKTIIFYDGVNDISAGCREEITQLAAYSEEIVIRQKLKESPFSEINNSIFSWIIKPYKIISNKLKFNINKKPVIANNTCYGDPKKAEKVARHLINNWHAAYLLANSNSIEFYAILQPSAFTTSSYKGHVLRNELYLQHKENNLTVYPLILKMMKQECPYSKDFCSRLIDGTKWTDEEKILFFDFCHLTKKGNEIIARNIINFLKKEN